MYVKDNRTKKDDTWTCVRVKDDAGVDLLCLTDRFGGGVGTVRLYEVAVVGSSN